MKTLNDVLDDAKKKKTFQITKSLDSHYESPILELKNYLRDKEDDSSVGLNFSFLSAWYLWHFIDSYIQKKEIKYELIAKSTYYAKESNNWNFALGILYTPYDFAIGLDTSVLHLGQMLYMNWHQLAKDYGHLLLKMLHGKQYNGGTIIPIYMWFMIELFCKWQKITLDKNKLRYPPHMGVYAQALDDFETRDTQKLSEIVQKLSSFHINNSSEDVVTDEYGNEEGAEFSDTTYFIFPVEILAWLAIRKDMGLPGYEPKNNPLMQMEINQLPSHSIPIPVDELVKQCKSKLQVDNPGVRFEL